MKKQAAKKAPTKRVRNRSKGDPVSLPSISANCPSADEVDGGQGLCNSKTEAYIPPTREEQIKDNRSRLNEIDQRFNSLVHQQKMLNAEIIQIQGRIQMNEGEQQELRALHQHYEKAIDRMKCEIKNEINVL